MGTSPTTKQFNLSAYQYLNDVVDDKYGQIKLYQKNETGEIICIQEKVIQIENKQKTYIKLEHPNLIKVHYYQEQIHRELCSSFIKITIVQEYVSNLLRNNIEHRVNKNVPFDEQQLWGLLKQLMNVLSYLKSNCIYPMDLKNILISNEGMIKIHTISNMSNYMQIMNQYTEDIHLSPEELDALKNRQIILDLDFEKCEIFQAGMTVLYAASLADTNSIYSYETLNYSEQELQIRIDELNYSQQFKDLLRKMLNNDIIQRGDFNQLSQLISYHECDNNLLRMNKKNYDKSTVIENSQENNYEYSSKRSYNPSQIHQSEFKQLPIISEIKENKSSALSEMKQLQNKGSMISTRQSKNQLGITYKPQFQQIQQVDIDSYNHRQDLESRVSDALNKSKYALEKFNETQQLLMRQDN